MGLKNQVNAYKQEFADLKALTYEEIEYSARRLWRLELTLNADKARVVQGKQNIAEQQLRQQWTSERDAINAKWLGVWEQELHSQTSNHKIKDVTQWARDMLELCQRNDSRLSSEFKGPVAAMQVLEQELKQRRDAIVHDMKEWQPMAEADGFPLKGQVGFGEFVQKSLDPAPTFFLAVSDTKEQGHPYAPQTSEEKNCLMCSLAPEDKSIAAFWGGHRDCESWGGQLPAGVRLVNSPGPDRIEVATAKLTPVDRNNFLELGAFQKTTLADDAPSHSAQGGRYPEEGP